jgi:hypothetical protein
MKNKTLAVLREEKKEERKERISRNKKSIN